MLARQVTHKNVVRIHDLGEIDGIKYITMPFIEGRGPGVAAAEARQGAGCGVRCRLRGRSPRVCQRRTRRASSTAI